MRIGASGRSGPTTVSRGTRSAGGGGDRFQLNNAPSAQSTQGASGVRPLAAVDTLLAIQEVPDHRARARRAIRRGEDMLDILDDMKISLLAGGLSESKLMRLMETVESRGDAVADPKLAVILDEIELRARVELAKRGRIAA